MACYVAQLVVAEIRRKNAQGKNTVLGLLSGTTPVDLYRELIRMHREEGLDFSQVTTFNLGEYYGLSRDQNQSLWRWMHEDFFDHVNIAVENIHFPDPSVPPDQVDAYCRQYEQEIKQAGGIDLLLLSIGQNGHIGFNEPFSIRHSRTRLCMLDPITRRVASADFFKEEHVPTQAITMGLGTCLDARKILLMALGEHKSSVIREATEGPVTDRLPASYLQEHADATVLLDVAAASELTDQATPWALRDVQWTPKLIKRAVFWLVQQTNKALLKLSDDDFREHNLHQLLRHHGPAQRLAHRVFRWMMNTIDYHPAGQETKRVICFSPHPDDDVISMGGTLLRLVQDAHEVHIAYMTSGNIAVFDHDAIRVADLVTQFNHLFDIDRDKSQKLETSVSAALSKKQPGQSDIEEVRKIKTLIRWSEAKAGALHVGCSEEQLHFLDLPFYRTGTVAKNPVGDEDVKIIRDLIESVDAQLIFVAGDLSDPHGTHRVCAEAIFKALLQIEQASGSRPEVLLYRGAWQEYDLDEIEIAVPLSPGDLERKKKAIFMHESQKDEALFPGKDPREFWQRAEDRNKGTAESYNQIGLPEYYALEAFVRWDGDPI